MPILLLIFLLFLSGSAHAADDALPDAAQEARAVELGSEIRCVVCQAESINDSGASMAHDMRRLVRTHIAAGESDDQIRNYLRSRYGDFILLRPPFQGNTYLLWVMPLMIVLVAAGWIGWFLWRRKLKRA